VLEFSKIFYFLHVPLVPLFFIYRATWSALVFYRANSCSLDADRKGHRGRPWGELSNEIAHASPFEGHHCCLVLSSLLQALMLLQ